MRRLRRKLPSTPGASLVASHLADQRFLGLTADARAKVRFRVQLIALMLAGLYAVGMVATGAIARLFDWERSGLEHPLQANKPLMLGMIVVSLAVWALARSPRLSIQAVCNLAVVYEIFLGLAIGYTRHSVPIPPDFMPMGFSPACVVIVLFPLVVPNTTGRTLAASLLTATAEVVAFLYWQGEGAPTPPAVVITVLLVPNFACAILAQVPSRIIHRMSRDVEKAMELGSYRLIEKLGQGGMGEVWRGKHNMLARPAAVKLVLAEALSDNPAQAARVLQRFEREAQATALLHSVHTIDLFDFGYTDGGTFYYVMELLDGLDLESLVERHGPLPAERVAHLIAQVCDSLEDAHTAGLIHRDIKPANIYVCRYGHRVDFVKVLDFGLVKLHTDIEGDATKLTREGAVTGTPAFVAPEVVTEPDDVDLRADLYSLGCVAYWLLTGSLVFEAKLPMQMILQHVQEEPVPPSQRTELPIPEALERIVLDCLAKDPGRRPQTAGELLSRLEAVGRANDWTSERARRWWDRHVPRGKPTAAESLAAATAVGSGETTPR